MQRSTFTAALLASTILAAPSAHAQTFKLSSPPPPTTVNINGTRGAIVVCDPATLYNFVGDGVTLNDNALVRWEINLAGNSGCLNFPAGHFKFSTFIPDVLIPGQNITLEGAGPATDLFSSGPHDFLSFTYPDNLVGGPNPLAGVVTIKDFRITTDAPASVAKSGVQTAIYIDGKAKPGVSVTPTTIENVTFEGHDKFSDWGTRISFHDVANPHVNHVKSNALCLALACNDHIILFFGTDGRHPTDLHVDDLFGIRGGDAIDMEGDFEGLFARNLELVAQNTGVICNNDGFSGGGICEIMGGHINSNVHDVHISHMSNNKIIGTALYLGARSFMPANSAMILLDNSTFVTQISATFQGFYNSGTYPNGIVSISSGISTIYGSTFNSLNLPWSIDAISSYWTGAANKLTGGTLDPVDLSSTSLIEYSVGEISYADSGGNNTHTMNHGAAATLGGNEYVSRLIAASNHVVRGFLDISSPKPISGTNCGADFDYTRYNNSGALVDVPFLENRCNGFTEVKSLLLGEGDSSALTTSGVIYFPQIPVCPPPLAGFYILCGNGTGFNVIGPSTTTRLGVP